MRAGPSFDFHGLIDPGDWLDRARIHGAVLEVDELRALSALVGRFRAFQEWQQTLSEELREQVPSLRQLAMPLVESRFAGLVQALDGKFEADGSIADHASPELARIRRQMERQQRAIEESLRSMLRRLGPEGSLQEDLITVRGERFVLPVKAEWKRRVPGVMHGASSSGQTYFIEPIETIEQNNELQRLLEEEQDEEHRILAAMTRQVGEHAEAIRACADDSGGSGVAVCAGAICGGFSMHCTGVSRRRGPKRIFLKAARHPLLEKTSARRSIGHDDPRAINMHPKPKTIVPLDLELPAATPQLIISGPNTGGKTVALKTVGLAGIDGAGRNSCAGGGGRAASV